MTTLKENFSELHVAKADWEAESDSQFEKKPSTDRRVEYSGYRSLSAEEIRNSRAEIARGEFVTLEALRKEVLGE